MKRILLLFSVLLCVPSVQALDDEPDQLCWEYFGMEPAFIRHFYEWAETHPLPFKAEAARVPEKAPCVRFAAYEFKTGNAAWHPDTKKGVRFLAGPGSHNFQDKGNVTIHIPESGVYRMWVRYRHTQGKNESFSLVLRHAPSANPAEDSIEQIATLFRQCFARSNPHPGRPCDPIPPIASVPTPPGGFMWEGTHRTAYLEKGDYVLSFLGGQFPNRPALQITDVLFTADPMLNPEGRDIPYGASMQEPSAEWKDARYGYRPGADRPDRVSPELLAYWEQWRAALLDKLAVSEYADYVWGYLASLVYFDEESNLIGRVAEVRRQKQMDARPCDAYFFKGTDFTACAPSGTQQRGKGWAYNEFQAKSYGCRDNISCPASSDDRTAKLELDIRQAGKYQLYIQYYGWGGTTLVELSGPDGKVFGSMLAGKESGINWNGSPRIELPAGKVTLTLKCAANPWNPGSNGTRVILGGVLTQRMDYVPGRREIGTSDGRNVGSETLGFWRSNDPWAGFTRYSRPGSVYYHQYRPLDWKLVPDEEINRTEHQVEVMSGEVLSELVMVRNNGSEKNRPHARSEGRCPRFRPRGDLHLAFGRCLVADASSEADEGDGAAEAEYGSVGDGGLPEGEGREIPCDAEIRREDRDVRCDGEGESGGYAGAADLSVCGAVSAEEQL